MMTDYELLALLEKESAAFLKKSRAQQAKLDQEWEAINKLTADELKLRQEIADIAQSVIDGAMSIQEAGARLEEFIKGASGHSRTL